MITALSIVLLMVVVFDTTAADSNCFVAENVAPNENVTFWLYNRTDRDPIKLNELALNPADFSDSRRSLVILIHGYTGHKDKSPNTHIRPKLLDRGDVYVISVDYNPLARRGCYLQAVQNLQVVGHCLAKLLDALVDGGFFGSDQIHVIGFSLGAHTAGITANYVKHPLKRITGLDPSKPFFTMLSLNERLDPTDALFIDVFHTSVTERGMMQPVGHVDFYPNFGFFQPGCLSDTTYPDVHDCSHQQAPIYYGKTIISQKGIRAVQICNHWYKQLNGDCLPNEPKLMGYFVSNQTKGVYFANVGTIL